MAKYSTEYKLKIVREYLAGQGGYRALSKRHEITESQIEHWVKAYRAFGEEGLKRSRAQQTYSFEFKRSAVECYLSTEASYQDVALAHGLNNPSMLVRGQRSTAVAEWMPRTQNRKEVSSNTGCGTAMGSLSHISCISIHIWICLTVRLSASISERHRLQREFRAHWKKRFV